MDTDLLIPVASVCFTALKNFFFFCLLDNAMDGSLACCVYCMVGSIEC